MNLPPVARRYAQALYREVAQKPRISEDIALLRDCFAHSPALVHHLENPVLPREKKLAVIQKLFAHRLHPTTMRFLRLVTKRKREMLLPPILEAYSMLEEKQRGVTTAYVRSAVPLTTDQQKRLQQQLAQQTGKQIRLELEQDPDIMGGLIIRIGDMVHDGSVRYHLSRLRSRLRADA